MRKQAYQSVPLDLLHWAFREGKTTVLRNYLLLRHHYPNSYFYTKDCPLNSNQLTQLKNKGWIRKIHHGYYHFVSVNTICEQLELRTHIRAILRNQYIDQAARPFRAYLAAKLEAFIIHQKDKHIRYAKRNGHGVTNRHASNLMSARYAAYKMDLSKSTIASYRRQYNGVHHTYTPTFCPVMDDLQLTSREQVAQYVDYLRYSDYSEPEKEARRHIFFDKKKNIYRARVGTLIHTIPYNTISDFGFRKAVY